MPLLIIGTLGALFVALAVAAVFGRVRQDRGFFQELARYTDPPGEGGETLSVLSADQVMGKFRGREIIFQICRREESLTYCLSLACGSGLEFSAFADTVSGQLLRAIRMEKVAETGDAELDGLLRLTAPGAERAVAAWAQAPGVREILIRRFAPANSIYFDGFTLQNRFLEISGLAKIQEELAGENLESLLADAEALCLSIEKRQTADNVQPQERTP